jgi:hypothetical protein
MKISEPSVTHRSVCYARSWGIGNFGDDSEGECRKWFWNERTVRMSQNPKRYIVGLLQSTRISVLRDFETIVGAERFYNELVRGRHPDPHPVVLATKEGAEIRRSK